MALQLFPHQELTIDGIRYQVVAHPAAKDMAYGQEGRQGIVYALESSTDRQALKIFRPRFRVPALVSLSEQIAPLAQLPGLRAARRTVLTARRHPDLVRQYDDLNYSVLMPWIEGPTWTEILGSGQPVTVADSLRVAQEFAGILAGWEERGLAHCDLSGPNVILPALADASTARPAAPIQRPSLIELVDLEQLYAPGLARPESLPAGSPGYAHRQAATGLWGAAADRFAGAILLAEMLGAGDPRVRAETWSESYFDPAEMQQASHRLAVLRQSLQDRWGAKAASLLDRAWNSETLADCPTFGEWLAALPSPTIRSTSSADPAPPGRGNYDLPGPSPADPRAESARKTAESFDAGLAAYQRKDWARACEYLAAVVRQDPGYQRNGEYAAALLAKAEQRRTGNGGPNRAWLIMGSLTAILLAVLLVGAFATATTGQHNGSPTPTGPPTSPVVNAAATQTAVGQALGDQVTATAIAATQTATVQALATAQQKLTVEALDVITQQGATSTVAAQARDTTTAQAAAVQTAARMAAEAATGTVVAQATSAAAAQATAAQATAQALAIANAGLAETATAQAATQAVAVQQTVDARLQAAAAATAQVQAQATAVQRTVEAQVRLAATTTARAAVAAQTAEARRQAAATATAQAQARLQPRIAFSSLRDKNLEIYTIGADGSGLTRLTADPAEDDYPAWSPNGQRLAFASKRDGTWHIYLMNPDGSGVTRLTNSPAFDRAPSWSPDGRRIAFASGNDLAEDIYVMNADGSGQRNLTNGGGNNWHPSWSPDGQWLTFTSNRTGKFQIYKIQADGSNLTRLTTNADDDSVPVWSTGTGRIAFASRRDGPLQIYTMRGDGSDVQRLTYDVADDGEPGWATNGQGIAFACFRDQNWEICTMGLDGSAVQNITNNSAANDYNPAYWRP